MMTKEDLRSKRRSWRTESVEDFLKAVYLLEQQVAPVPTTLLARSLTIEAPSVTDMIKRLATAQPATESSATPPMPQLLDYEPYKGVTLTEAGRKIALEVVRHHRLLELYLTQKLGYSWDEVHEEADSLEHYISERLEAKIAEALDQPVTDPHGDPIPALDGTLPEGELILLADLPVGQPAEVRRIIDQTPEVLRYLSDIDLTPGATVRLTERAPLNDTVSLRVGKATHTISTQVARKVLVNVRK
jgi:DtxR family Mn-dependent transcriptional regulator